MNQRLLSPHFLFIFYFLFFIFFCVEQSPFILDFKLSPCPECCIIFLGDSPASEFYIPTFRNTLFHLRRQVGLRKMNSAGACLGYYTGKGLAREPNLFPYNTTNMSPADFILHARTCL